ncbi:MAG: glycerophosphodiester phosphodiesterase, partial [Clostridia bacterium]|nr:glycerophosphodiester phosphodiesterase [Clostridia bacterium]
YLITALLTNVLARPHFLARGQDSARNPSFLIGKHLFHAPSYVWTVRAQDQIPSPESGEGIIFEGFIPKD